MRTVSTPGTVCRYNIALMNIRRNARDSKISAACVGEEETRIFEIRPANTAPGRCIILSLCNFNSIIIFRIALLSRCGRRRHLNLNLYCVLKRIPAGAAV